MLKEGFEDSRVLPRVPDHDHLGKHPQQLDDGCLVPRRCHLVPGELRPRVDEMRHREGLATKGLGPLRLHDASEVTRGELVGLHAPDHMPRGGS
ncbi:hypothetical protein T492DRAFT_1045496 [Pavlovales sp. CCMP2436]|nr:hypothetical protein T492DRAFT_1045496 [Pavlovales sp. CCMP2436]